MTRADAVNLVIGTLCCMGIGFVVIVFWGWNR